MSILHLCMYVCEYMYLIFKNLLFYYKLSYFLMLSITPISCCRRVQNVHFPGEKKPKKVLIVKQQKKKNSQKSSRCSMRTDLSPGCAPTRSKAHTHCLLRLSEVENWVNIPNMGERARNEKKEQLKADSGMQGW